MTAERRSGWLGVAAKKPLDMPVGLAAGARKVRLRMGVRERRQRRSKSRNMPMVGELVFLHHSNFLHEFLVFSFSQTHTTSKRMN